MKKTSIRSFIHQTMPKLLSWISLGTLLAFLSGRFGSKDHVSNDIIGNTFKNLTGKTIDFQNFFLGDNLDDRRKLLSYALIFLGLIILLSPITDFIRLALESENPYIKNGKFYFYNKIIFSLNTVSWIFNYITITLFFVSAQTFFLLITFIFFNSWLVSKKLITESQDENFFTWKDSYVKKIIACSSLVIFILPFVYDRINITRQQASEQINSSSISKLTDLFQKLINQVPSFKIVVDIFFNLTSLIHWTVLLWFVPKFVFGRIDEYKEFWDKVDDIDKQAANFKHFYYYHKLLNEGISPKNANKETMILGEYGFLQITPQFTKNEYLEQGKNKKSQENIIEKFNKKIEQNVEFINLLPKKLDPIGKSDERQKQKVKFLTYCLFNEFKSSEEVEETRRLVLNVNKFNSN